MFHSCEICGQEGLIEEELRLHMTEAHIKGSAQCPFCDLNGVSAELTVCPSLKLGVVFLRNLHQFPAPDAAVKGLTEGLIAMATGGVGQR